MRVIKLEVSYKVIVDNRSPKHAIFQQKIQRCRVVMAVNVTMYVFFET